MSRYYNTTRYRTELHWHFYLDGFLDPATGPRTGAAGLWRGAARPRRATGALVRNHVRSRQWRLGPAGGEAAADGSGGTSERRRRPPHAHRHARAARGAAGARGSGRGSVCRGAGSVCSGRLRAGACVRLSRVL
eukprot:1188789-Prorocentrum_minimum.AAC.1